MHNRSSIILGIAVWALLASNMVPGLHGQTTPAPAVVSSEDQELLTDLASFLKTCSADQINWLAESRILIDEPEQQLKVKMARAGKGEFYGQLWIYVVRLQKWKERPGETSYEKTIAQFAAGLPTGIQPALGIVRFHRFSDQQGREIEAELLRMDGHKVIAAFKGGSEFEMPVASLIDGDRKKVESWIEKQADRATPKLVTEATLEFSQKQTLVLCPYPNIVPESVHQGATLEGKGYEVTIENRGREELPALTAHYYIFYHLGPQTNSASAKHLRGEAKISKLDYGDDSVFTTIGAHPFENILGQYMGALVTNTANLDIDISSILRSIQNGKNSFNIPDVKLAGLWLRIYSGTNLVAEHTYGKGAEDAQERFKRPSLTAPVFEFPDAANENARSNPPR